ncbi:MAG: hypothetical protein Q9217_000990 [Psora testacea]
MHPYLASQLTTSHHDDLDHGYTCGRGALHRLMAMDHAAYHIIYVDTRISQDLDGKHLQKTATIEADEQSKRHEESWEERDPDCLKSILGEIEEVRSNLKRILSHFNGVHTCSSGKTCMANLRRLDTVSADQTPMLVLSGTTSESGNELCGSRASNMASVHPGPSDSEGFALLQHLSSEISNSNLSKLVIPVAMIHDTGNAVARSHPFPRSAAGRPSSGGLPTHGPKSSSAFCGASKKDQAIFRDALKCIDAGAVDVLTSPLQEDRLHSLIFRAYRTHKEVSRDRADIIAKKRSRKLSWLGNTESKPYAYLREKMVSELMTGICDPDEYLHITDHKTLGDLDPRRESHLKSTLGTWAYSGHSYDEDELVHAACFMLQHALKLPELERWRLPPAQLTSFVMASRAAYNDFVDYHNFRHVVDVMQAIFYFLIQLGSLPAYPAFQPSFEADRRKTPIAALLKPLDALTLLITAIGHDVGHPGVNNAFLVALNAPLAQLYNDKSVLEAFHCAAYSQILRRYWRAAFEDTEIRSLMINSILATDMGVHQKYMADLGNLQEKLHHNQGTDGFNASQLEEYRILACALLIKCADISNVARPYDIAVQWANILQLEFANQGMMEQDVGIPTTLFGGPPELGNVIKLGQSQNSFMNFFARPLFGAVTDILPAMAFAVDELKINQATWTERIRLENEGATQIPRRRDPSPGGLSPRSTSPDRAGGQAQLSHPEGLPASSPSPEPLLSMTQSQPVLPSQTGRLSDGAGQHPLVALHSNTLTHNSRRSSHDKHFIRMGLTPDSSADFSYHSPGVVSAASNPTGIGIQRRESNTSPCQLEIASESRAHTDPSITTSENRRTNGRASEDTLSRTNCSNGVTSLPDSRRGSANSGGAGNVARRSSKGPEQLRSNNQSISYSTSSRSYIHSGRHRSSSGAHTNNTNVSQSTPYSPTGTKATSVLTVDSDEKSSQSRLNSWTERNGLPDVPDVERPGSDHRLGNLVGVGGGAKDADVKTSVYGNGNLRDPSSPGQRSIGKKSSRFNIFYPWKRRGNRLEASP